MFLSQSDKAKCFEFIDKLKRSKNIDMFQYPVIEGNISIIYII